MKECMSCGSRLELVKYDRETENGDPRLVYECSFEECEDKTEETVHAHKPQYPRTKEQLKANYFRHMLEV